MDEQDKNNLDQSEQPELPQNDNLGQSFKDSKQDNPMTSNSLNLSKRTKVSPWAWVLVILAPILLIGAIWGFIKIFEDLEIGSINVEIRESQSMWEWFSRSDDGLSVKNDKNISEISYDLPDGTTESFYIKGRDIDDAVTRYISSLSDNTLDSPFFIQGAQEIQLRIIDITFDISGSVRDLIKKQPNYRQDILDTLDANLIKENIRPGDRIRIRFLGGNPAIISSSPYSIDFVGPKFTYDINLQRSKNKTLLEIRGYTLDYVPQSNSGLDYARSLKELRDMLKEKYISVTDNPYSFGYRTYLVGHLNEIIRQNQNEGFSSILYIMLTDGEFNLEYYIANRTGGYCSVGTFQTCHSRLIDLIEKGEVLRQNHAIGKELSKDKTKDKVIFIGFNNYNNDNYQDSAEVLFQTMFDNATVNLL